MKKLLFALPLFALMAFTTPESTDCTTEGMEMMACTAPAAPDGILLSAMAPYFADARYVGGNIPANVAGYYWTITGGYITSGQGTSVIYYEYGANSTSVTLCVRAYSQEGRQRCYSSETCTFMSTELN